MPLEILVAITVYLRHRQIVEFYWHHYRQEGRWRTISCIILWLGYASAFGVSMVANFQVSPVVWIYIYWAQQKNVIKEGNVIVIHYIGALLAFGCGLVYTWAQTIFSYQMNPKL